jgi:molecular chaperone GrpE
VLSSEGDLMKKPGRRRARFDVQKKRLLEKIESEREKSQELLNRLKYLQADFENYQKRVEKETQEIVLRSNERLIVNLLNVVDDLERAIETGKRIKKVEPLLEGVEMVYRTLNSTLEREGLVGIEAVGKPFDPNVHEFLAKVPKRECEEGIVVEETRRGFMFKGKVVRSSIVKISCKENEVKNNE